MAIKHIKETKESHSEIKASPSEKNMLNAVIESEKEKARLETLRDMAKNKPAFHKSTSKMCLLM